jgi:ABC-type bacteriocin/lantibiotic exporter with double-glycine peptidase domain
MTAVLAALTVAGVLDLSVPFVPQEKNTCAAASLAMVLRYWGRQAAPAEIAGALLQPELRGIAGSQLAAFARERRLLAVAYEGDLEQLRDYLAKGRPLIVAWKVGRNRYHNVVAVGFDEERDEVLVNDPGEGASRRLSARTFEERWAGAGHWTLFVQPAPP